MLGLLRAIIDKFSSKESNYLIVKEDDVIDNFILVKYHGVEILEPIREGEVTFSYKYSTILEDDGSETIDMANDGVPYYASRDSKDIIKYG